MNKALKWILIGLGIALVVFFVAMAALRGFAFRPAFMMGSRVPGFHYPLGGMMFGMGLVMLFRVLLGATVLGFAVFGVIALFRNHKSIPANQVDSTAPQVQAAAEKVEPQRTCVKCSQPLQSDWKNCPYCGKKQ